MRTKRLLSKIVSAGFFISLIILVVMACKKKDDTPEPPPSVPMQTPLTPNAFNDVKPKIMTDYEIANNFAFPGHLTRLIGKGIANEVGSEIPEPLEKIGDIAWEVYDYKHTEARFDEIDNTLNQIQNQIAQCSTEISNLSAQFSLTASELEQLSLVINLNTYLNSVQTSMGKSTNAGLQWYPMRLAAYKSGDSTVKHADIKSDSAALFNLCSNIFYANNDIRCSFWELQLYSTVDLGMGVNGLGPLTDLLIQKAKAESKYDANSVMNCYLILESYFMQIVNAQYQCGILLANANNYFNPQDTASIIPFFPTQLYIHLKVEVSMFLTAVDQMVVNLNDYRNPGRFSSDMSDASLTGLVQDQIFIHVLGRANLLANMIYDGMGYNYPVVSGTILTPWNYTDGNSPIVTTLSLNFTPQSAGGTAGQTSSTAITMPSQIPYTYWIAGDPASCASDNRWNIYHFIHDTLGTKAVAPKYQITIVDNGNGFTPWVHYNPIQGTITPLWYNPQNPTQTSATKTSSCTFQFGYFCSSWPWGFLMSNAQNYWHNVNYGPYHMNGGVKDEGVYSTPNQVTTNVDGTGYGHPGTFSYPHGNMGLLVQGGNTVETLNYYTSFDMWYCNIKTTDIVPPNGGTLQAWEWFNIGYNMAGSEGDDLWVNIGLTLSKVDNGPNNPEDYYSNGEVVNNWHVHDVKGSWNSGSGIATMGSSKSYQPAFFYYYQTSDIGTVPAFINMYNGFQVLYGGFYNYTSL